MLDIYINGKIIEIKSNFKGVSIEIINSLFSDKTTHSFSFYLPKTESIIEALNYVTLDNSFVNSTNNNIKFVYNSLQLSGTFKIIDISDDIECYFINDLNALTEKYKNLMLRDLTYSVFSNINAAAASSYPTYSYTAHPIDITNEELLTYFNDSIPEFQGGSKWLARIFVNYPLTNNSFLSGEIKAAVIGSSGANRINYIYSYLNPFFYTSFVVAKIFETLGINVIENVFETDSDLKKLTINYLNPKENISTIYLKDYVPDISAIQFIKSLEVFGVKVLFNFNKNEVSIINIIDKINAAPTDNLTYITEKIKSHGVIERFNFRLQYDLSQNDIYLEKTGNFSDYDYIENANNSRKDLPFNICPIDTIKEIANPPSTFLGLSYFLYNESIIGGNYKVYYRQFEVAKINTKLKVSEIDVTSLVFEGEQKLRMSFFDNTVEEAFRLYYNSSTAVNEITTGQAYPSGFYKTPTLSFEFTSNIGVFYKKQKPLLIWENQFKIPIKAKINFPSDKISAIEDGETYIVDNYKCFISKISLTLKTNKIELGDSEFFTV